jgi:hypothetical protein
MVSEKVKAFALKREIQVLAILTIITGVGYYVYLKNKQKKSE